MPIKVKRQRSNSLSHNLEVVPPSPRKNSDQSTVTLNQRIEMLSKRTAALREDTPIPTSDIIKPSPGAVRTTVATFEQKSTSSPSNNTGSNGKGVIDRIQLLKASAANNVNVQAIEDRVNGIIRENDPGEDRTRGILDVQLLKKEDVLQKLRGFLFLQILFLFFSSFSSTHIWIDQPWDPITILLFPFHTLLSPLPAFPLLSVYVFHFSPVFLFSSS